MKKTDWIRAKDLVEFMPLFTEETVKPDNIGNFRKYLTEISTKQGLGQEFSTKITDVKKKELRVIRVK